jgi:transposase
MVVEIRKRFDVGKTTAEQAIKRANEIFREQAAQLFTQDRIIAHLARLAENAERKGDDRTAARIVEAIARVSGVQAPEKFEDVTSGGLRAEDLTPEQLEALAALEG